MVYVPKPLTIDIEDPVLVQAIHLLIKCCEAELWPMKLKMILAKAIYSSGIQVEFVSNKYIKKFFAQCEMNFKLPS